MWLCHLGCADQDSHTFLNDCVIFSISYILHLEYSCVSIYDIYRDVCFAFIFTYFYF